MSQRTMKTIVYTVAPSSHLLEAVTVERGRLGAWQSQWSLQVQTDKHISQNPNHGCQLRQGEGHETACRRQTHIS